MVDASKLKPGDKVTFRLGKPGSPVSVQGGLTASGLSEPVNYGEVFTVADPPIPWGIRYMANLEWPPGKNGVLECSQQYLDYVKADDPVDALHEMRNAGPPAPASCVCDVMTLMRVGCKCGYLAKEAANG